MSQQQPFQCSSDFAFNFTPLDDLADGQRWSTWSSVERGLHGPEPRPPWVVTADAAVDTELGVLKTGKEADVFLLERAVPDDSVSDDAGQHSVLAAKRYRTEEHRSFHRASSYTEGRRTRRSRDARAIANKTSYGREAAAGQWAYAEFDALSRLWSAGVPVPYPVQVDGTELLMELITSDDGRPAPRLAQARAERDVIQGWWDQLADAMHTLARAGITHGDLSPYNLLVADERLVLIDLPQVVDLVGNPQGLDFLARDCHNVCRWFGSRGVAADEHELFGDLMASAFGAPS
ncbi:MAG: phosphotransferase [Actinomycetota bacterium]|nr:phosphotransferase [Actinomycetota bacterium]